MRPLTIALIVVTTFLAIAWVQNVQTSQSTVIANTPTSTVDPSTPTPRPTWTSKPRMCLHDSTNSFDDVWAVNMKRETMVSLPPGVTVIVDGRDSEHVVFTYRGSQFITGVENVRRCD